MGVARVFSPDQNCMTAQCKSSLVLPRKKNEAENFWQNLRSELGSKKSLRVQTRAPTKFGNSVDPPRPHFGHKEVLGLATAVWNVVLVSRNHGGD